MDIFPTIMLAIAVLFAARGVVELWLLTAPQSEFVINWSRRLHPLAGLAGAKIAFVFCVAMALALIAAALLALA